MISSGALFNSLAESMLKLSQAALDLADYFHNLTGNPARRCRLTFYLECKIFNKNFYFNGVIAVKLDSRVGIGSIFVDLVRDDLDVG